MPHQKTVVKANGEKVTAWFISLDEYEEMDQFSQGVCLGCGEVRDCCEPDARKYKCEECEQNRVYGAAELVLIGRAE